MKLMFINPIKPPEQYSQKPERVIRGALPVLKNWMVKFLRGSRSFAEAEIRHAGNFVEKGQAVFIMPDMQRWNQKSGCTEISAGRSNSADLRCGSAYLGLETRLAKKSEAKARERTNARLVA